MITSAVTAEEISSLLLQIKAIKLNPQNPFTWASGWKSPIYCDNRVSLTYPGIRSSIKNHFCKIISEKFSQTNLIAGVATAGIAHGALIADKMNLPFVYVRFAPKKHGMENLIEGKITGGENVVVVEDLISTGKSSLVVVNALKEAGCNVLGLAAIFTYNFEIAEKSFREINCPFYTLTDYTTLISLAVKNGTVQQNDLLTLQNWRMKPGEWGR